MSSPDQPPLRWDAVFPDGSAVMTRVLLFPSLLALLLLAVTGGPSRAQPHQATYRLPLDCGREFAVQQGNDATLWDRRDPELSHAGIFALDFIMPEGTKLRAA